MMHPLEAAKKKALMKEIQNLRKIYDKLNATKDIIMKNGGSWKDINGALYDVNVAILRNENYVETAFLDL